VLEKQLKNCLSVDIDAPRVDGANEVIIGLDKFAMTIRKRRGFLFHVVIDDMRGNWRI
jgi:hypothetical protein